MMWATKNQTRFPGVFRRPRRAVSIGALIAVLLVPTLAQAGQDCTARRPDAAAMARDLDLAASVAQQLDERFHRDGVELILLARAGQDLSRHGLRYSHLGIAYRDHAAVGGRGAWRVVHKLNACGSDRSTLHRPTLPSSTRSGSESPRPAQRFASDTTRRRLRTVSSKRAPWPSSTGCPPHPAH